MDLSRQGFSEDTDDVVIKNLVSPEPPSFLSPTYLIYFFIRSRCFK